MICVQTKKHGTANSACHAAKNVSSQKTNTHLFGSFLGKRYEQENNSSNYFHSVFFLRLPGDEKPSSAK